MVGRLHPMIDNDLRIRRLKQEADDPSVAVILLDIVLGYGAHPDPASELAPAIADARARAARGGHALEFVAVVIGTDEDPQDFLSQVERLRQAGARVMATHEAAARHVGEMLGSYHREDAKNVGKGAGEWASGGETRIVSHSPALPLSLAPSFAAINVGIESFFDSLKSQDAQVVQVDWKPPAGGNEKLMAILEKLKSK
jgi:FdrA protein